MFPDRALITVKCCYGAGSAGRVLIGVLSVKERVRSMFLLWLTNLLSVKECVRKNFLFYFTFSIHFYLFIFCLREN